MSEIEPCKQHITYQDMINLDNEDKIAKLTDINNQLVSKMNEQIKIINKLTKFVKGEDDDKN